MRMVLNGLYDGNWSAALRTLYDAMGAMATLSVNEMPSIDCLYASASRSDPRQMHKLAVNLMTPILVLLPLLGAFRLYHFAHNPFKCRQPHPEAPGLFDWQVETHRIVSWAVTGVLGVLSLAIPAAIRAALGILVCDPNPVSGLEYLRVDIAIGCADVAGMPRISAICALVIYGLGFPALIFWMLRRQRYNRDNVPAQRRIAWLVAGYRKRYIYWELWMLARMLLIVVIAMTVQAVVARTAMVLLVVQLALFLHLNRQPYHPHPHPTHH